MAYNPFDFFRRNQKTAFAALTIFVMFTFVLSFGQGDFFQWLPGWLGSFKNRGKDVMLTIDGRKVYDAELYKHDDDRQLADEFMKSLMNTVLRDTDENLRETLKSGSKEAKDAIGRFLQLRQTGYLDPQILQMAQQGQLQMNMLQQFQQMSRNQTQTAVRQLLVSPNSTSADQDLAKTATELMRLDEQAEGINRTGTYFAYPGRARTNEERLEYELWLRKADKLGIVIRPEDSPALVKDDLGSQVTPEIWNTVEKSFASKINFSRSRLLGALADEYRVRAAVDVVMGKAVGTTTPYATYQFFKDQCDAATYMVMSVPSENFLDKVTEKPSDSELRGLFEKYKSAEPDPARETPGFREPRKLKLAWLEVRGDEPYYTKQAEQVWTQGEAGVRLAGLGFGPIGSALTSTLADPALQSAYANYRSQFAVSIDTKWYPFRTTTDEILDTSVVRPQNVAAALGTFVAAGLTKGSPLTAGLVFKERAAQYERNDRARVLIAMLAPSTVAGTNLLGNVLVGGAAMPLPLPLAAVRGELIDGVKSGIARSRAEKDLRDFSTELTRLGTRKDKSEARSYVEKFLAERGLKHGMSTEFRDQYSIDEDPGLAVLAEKKDRGHGMSDLPIRFGPRFFVNANDPRSTAPLSYFEPKTFPPPDPRQDFGIVLRPDEPTYLTWRTESIEPKTPREFKEVREKVEAAWTRAKARELAKSAAEELRKRIEKNLVDEKAENDAKLSQVIRDTHSKFQLDQYGNGPGSFDKLLRDKFFYLDKVTPIRTEKPLFDVRGTDVQPVAFQLSHLEKKDLPYPTVEMARALLAAKDKPLGTTVLEPDRAKDVYYVSVLVKRENSSMDYYRELGIAEGRTPLAGAIREVERAEAMRKVRDTTFDLLKAEFKVANESEKMKEKSGGLE